MGELANGAQRFEVHQSAAVSELLFRIHDRASRQGQGSAVAMAYLNILERLELEARTLGEPLYRLPNLRLQIRAVAVRPILVEFGVLDDRPIVFIKTVRTLHSGT